MNRRSQPDVAKSLAASKHDEPGSQVKNRSATRPSIPNKVKNQMRASKQGEKSNESIVRDAARWVRPVRSVRSNLIVRRVGSFVLPEAIRDDLIHVTRGLSRESGGEVLPMIDHHASSPRGPRSLWKKPKSDVGFARALTSVWRPSDPLESMGRRGGTR